MRRLAVLTLGILVALPLSAATKQETHDQLVALGAQIETLKGHGESVADLIEQYRALSADLGFDDPAGILGDRGASGAGGATEGAPPAPPGGATTTTNFAATDTPLAITDLATTTSMITVAGVDTYLFDLDMTTDITHTFASDLEMTLTSPAGTVVTISTDNGGANDDVFSGTLWDDDGGDTNPPGPATDNTYANLVTETPLVSEEAMGAFIGEDPNGTWTLDIFDDAGGDVGTLNDWSIDVTTLALAPIFTGPTNFLSTDTPLPITDLATTTSNLAVSGLDTYLCDVDMTTDITHTFASDLEITLTSPAGTVVTIATDSGGANDDVFAGTLWDDDGGDTNPPGPASDNTYANLVTETPLVPEEAMAAFIGEDPNGTWTLDIFDDAGGDTGTLNSWSVDVTTCVGVAPQPPVIEIPTINRAGLILLILVLAVVGAWALTRRQ